MAAAKPFAIEVNFLTGRYVATYHNDRQRGEWPPHPARLFSALVASWAEDGGDSTEREALEWLEIQGPPRIDASEAVPRSVVSHFVPVNDPSIIGGALQTRKADRISKLLDELDDELVASSGEVTKKVSRLQDRLAKERDVEKQVTVVGKTPTSSAIAMLPDRQGAKQERTFPSVTPNDARVTYIWEDAAPEAICETLDGLLQRVTRLGHSSSLVSCRVTTEPPEARYRPGGSGGEPADRQPRSACRTRAAIRAPSRCESAVSALYGRPIHDRSGHRAAGGAAGTEHGWRVDGL